MISTLQMIQLFYFSSGAFANKCDFITLAEKNIPPIKIILKIRGYSEFSLSTTVCEKGIQLLVSVAFHKLIKCYIYHFKRCFLSI